MSTTPKTSAGRLTLTGTIQAARGRARERPLALTALAVTLGEAALAAIGSPLALLSAVVLIGAPGLALLPLLPERALRSPSAALAAAPALGIAASTVVLITLASAGAPLDGWVAR